MYNGIYSCNIHVVYHMLHVYNYCYAYWYTNIRVTYCSISPPVSQGYTAIRGGEGAYPRTAIGRRP